MQPANSLDKVVLPVPGLPLNNITFINSNSTHISDYIIAMLISI